MRDEDDMILPAQVTTAFKTGGTGAVRVQRLLPNPENPGTLVPISEVAFVFALLKLAD